MIFSFLSFPSVPTSAFPERSRISRPVLQVQLQYGKRAISILSIVDSGADDCIFPISVAQALGIPVPNSKAYTFFGTSNRPQTAYFENVRASIETQTSPEPAFHFELYAGFCETLEHLGMGLLGQNGFFSRFKVAIDRTAERFEIVER